MTATDRAVQLVNAAAEAAADKLATDIVAFDVSDQLAITDAFMLCSAPNDRQVRAIVDAVEERLSSLGAKPARREGAQQGRWVLLDYLDVVVHVQHAEERVYYALERLWRDCPAIPLDEQVEAGPHPAVVERGSAGQTNGAAAGRGHASEPGHTSELGDATDGDEVAR